jgi:t-SNARE complex subunit (syntaxin)
LLIRYEDILHASGLSKKQGQKVLGYMVDLSAQMEAEAKVREEKARADNLAALEKEFGDGMDLKVRQIKAALGEFGGDASLAALVEQTNYHPGLVQFLAYVGEQLASSRLVTGDSPKLSTSRQAALDEIKRLELDEAFQVDYRGSDSDKRQDAVNRMNGLYRIAYPQTPDI